MIEQWTGEIISIMHINGILKRNLAEKLGYSPEYTGKVLNGKANPKNAEAIFRKAVNELLKERSRNERTNTNG